MSSCLLFPFQTGHFEYLCGDAHLRRRPAEKRSRFTAGAYFERQAREVSVLLRALQLTRMEAYLSVQ